MTTTELVRLIRQAILNVSANVINYDGQEYAINQLRKLKESIKNSPNFRPIDPNEIDVQSYREFGFHRWDDEDDLYLIPAYLHPFLAENFVCGSIADATPKIRNMSEIDSEERFGCLAFGIKPNNPRKNNDTRI